MSSQQQQQYMDIPSASAVPDVSSSSYGNNKKQGTDGGRGGDDDSIVVVKGEVQPPEYRDFLFAILFWIQFLTVVALTCLYYTGTIQVALSLFDNDSIYGSSRSRRFLKEHQANNSSSFAAPLALGLISALIVAPALTIWMFTFLSNNATKLIQTSLYVGIGINIALSVFCLVTGAVWPAIMTGLGAVFTWMYARAVWHRIPLAAANLKTAVAAIQSQLMVAFLGLASLPFYAIWWTMWIYSFVYTLNTDFMQSQVSSTKIVHSGASFKQGDEDYSSTLDAQYSGLWWFLVFCMLVSFYWTTQVIGNTVQTTVAGTVGTFWFVPEEAMGCCSPALGSSFFRSVTYSFGSICMGSLIVAIIQALIALVRQAEQSARQNREGAAALLLCIFQCILRMLEAAAEYFNKWAFIYVGLYGYDYLTAGKNVITLFKHRGWTTIITDNLTSRVLGMLSFAIGLGTGLVAAVIAAVTAVTSSNIHDQGTVGGLAGGSLLIALLLGMILSSIIFSVVNSAADTVVVLFAEAPGDLVHNHPALAEKMNRAWSNAYPDVFTPVTTPSMVV